MNRHQYPVAKKQVRTVSQGQALIVQGLLRDALRHHQAGQLTEAARTYRQILAIDAHQADSLHLLGMIAYKAGGYDAAVSMIRRAIAINKKDASYHCNLGTVLQAQDKLEEATACYERALTLKPDLAEVHVNLGNIFQAQNKLDDAVACYERALALKPELAEAHHSMGNALFTGDKLDEAVACYEWALILKPGYAEAHYNLGCAFRALGRVDEALERYRIALALQPNYIQAGFRESLAQLLKEEFAAGWGNYERRWQYKDHGTPMRAYPQPLWTGGTLASGRVLIWPEQGVGDEIMFAGLIPDVTRTGTRCMLDCDPRLKTLFSRSFPGIDVISGNEMGSDPGHNPELNISAHLPCGSLPGLFRASHSDFAATKSPYLIADARERERFRIRYANGDAGANSKGDAKRKRLIGLAWHTTNRKTGRFRSIELSRFAPLFAQPDIQWVSLQYGNHDALEKEASAAGVPILTDRAVDQLSNIDVFAAQVAAMDMVITIDNSTAHLAGALGVPVWVLLPFAADWRWMQKREDSPWYPTMRLFRQPTRGDWQSVVQKVLRAL
jgi:tetratricopeptide (TPR) repeat protein